MNPAWNCAFTNVQQDAQTGTRAVTLNPQPQALTLNPLNPEASTLNSKTPPTRLQHIFQRDLVYGFVNTWAPRAPTLFECWATGANLGRWPSADLQRLVDDTPHPHFPPAPVSLFEIWIQPPMARGRSTKSSQW